MDLDRAIEIKEIMDSYRWFGSNSTWQVYKNGTKFWLGVRTHDLGGSDHDYIEQITDAEYDFFKQCHRFNNHRINVH